MMSRAKEPQRIDGSNYWNQYKENQRMKQCQSFCLCDFPEHLKISEHKGQIAELCECRCGEDDPNIHELQWHWYHLNESNVAIMGPNVTFHPTYSQGTAIIRGDKSLEAGRIHYWEIRILTVTYGTDVMFGIGTDKVDLLKYKFHFISALGIDSESWGLSYTGKFRHNGIQTQYVQAFSQGCIIGIYVDRSRGTLEYYLNRRPLGIVSNKIPTDNKVKIYPMVASTTARSAIRLINATSQIDCLQLRAYQMLAKQNKCIEELKKMPGFRRIVNSYWFLAPPIRYSKCNPNDEYDLLDEAVISTSLLKNRLARKQKYKDNDDIEDNDALYSNATKIASNQQRHLELDPYLNVYCNNYLSDDLYSK